jgi:hypothetical protein
MTEISLLSLDPLQLQQARRAGFTRSQERVKDRNSTENDKTNLTRSWGGTGRRVSCYNGQLDSAKYFSHHVRESGILRHLEPDLRKRNPSLDRPVSVARLRRRRRGFPLTDSQRQK